MSRIHIRWLAAVSVLLLLSLFLVTRRGRVGTEPAAPAVSSAPAENQEPDAAIRPQRLELTPGSNTEHRIAGGDLHRYDFDLEAGDYLQLVVDQLGVDVGPTLFDPGGAEILAVNSWNGTEGPEPVAAVAEETGTYRLEIRPYDEDAPAGRYRLRIEAHRDATTADRQRARAARAFSDAEALLGHGGEPALGAALELYRAAAKSWQASGETPRADAARARIAWIHDSRGEMPEALRAYEQALERFRQSGGSHWLEPWALLRLGVIHQQLDDGRAALERYEEALQAARESGNGNLEITILTRLANLHSSRGKTERAARYYEQALARAREIGDRGREARTLPNVVDLYLGLGQLEPARILLDDALALSQSVGDRTAEARALNQLGVLERQTGDLEASRTALERSLALRRQLGDRVGEAATLKHLGLTRIELGEHWAAGAALDQALALARELQDGRLEGGIVSNLGWFHHRALGDPERALAHYDQALEILRRAGFAGGEASALHGAARAERDRGELAAACRRIEEALAVVESLRASTEIVDQRSSYLATKQDYYELYIDLLADLHRRDPAAGHAGRALEISERRRARSLLDVLTQSVDAAGPSLRLASRGSAPEVPRLRTADIQRLLDDDTLLLEYSLGDERSFLWRVTPSEVELHELPGRARLEKLGRTAYRLLSESRGRRGRAQLRLVGRELSDLLLAPVAGRLAERLLVVGDGVLQVIPFGALPTPRPPGSPAAESDRPLVTEHEIVYLPSLAVLAVLRQDLGARSPAPRTVAVVADPVFDRRDPRLGTPQPAATLAGDPPAPLDRLLASRREAEAILALAPAGEGFAALGFAASREMVMGGALADYRLVHLATHTLFDPRKPAFSGLVLSRFDESGRPREGLLRPGEVYGLELAAEMVVLSACRSGLGKEVRGEGLVGLTQGFLYAGAARVVVSFWPVDDEASAELMAGLYRGILEDGLPAAAALRSAQLAMHRNPRWHAPYYWAGFFLLGEWR